MHARYWQMSGRCVSVDYIQCMDKEPGAGDCQHESRRPFTPSEHLDDTKYRCGKIGGEGQFKEDSAHQKQPSSRLTIFIPSPFATSPTSLEGTSRSSAILRARPH